MTLCLFILQTNILLLDICKKIKDYEKRIYLLRTIIVYQQCYLLEDDDEIFETHLALAKTLQYFADSGGSSIWRRKSIIKTESSRMYLETSRQVKAANLHINAVLVVVPI